jgi:hypothetical protein
MATGLVRDELEVVKDGWKGWPGMTGRKDPESDQQGEMR